MHYCIDVFVVLRLSSWDNCMVALMIFDKEKTKNHNNNKCITINANTAISINNIKEIYIKCSIPSTNNAGQIFIYLF